MLARSLGIRPLPSVHRVSVVIAGHFRGRNSDDKEIRLAQRFPISVVLQNFDLLTAASKDRTIEKCHVTYGSEISIIISLRSTGRRFDQIFPSLALDPGSGRRLS